MIAARTALRAIALALFVVFGVAPKALAQVEVYEVAVEGFASPFVAFSLERALRTVPGVASVELDFQAGAARAVVAEGATVALAQIMHAAELVSRPLRYVRLRARGIVRGNDLTATLVVDGRTMGRITSGPALADVRALLARGKREVTIRVEVRQKVGPVELVVLEVHELVVPDPGGHAP